MTREEIYNSIWTIAQNEVRSHGYRFSDETEILMKAFIRHGVYSNMTTSDIVNGSKIAEAEHNMREICQELCRRESQQRRGGTIVESRTFTATRFQFCPRYPFC